MKRMAIVGVLVCLGVSAAPWGHADGLEQEPPSPVVMRADRLFRHGVESLQARRYDEARMYFEHALKWNRNGADVFYNLVEATRRLKLWDKVALFGQGFVARERGTRDAYRIAAEVDAAFARLARDGRVAVAYRFDVEPEGAEVLVDGVPVATSAKQEVRLLPGTYQVTARLEDYAPWSRELEVSAGQPAVVTAELVPMVFSAVVRITTVPAAGVEVWLDERKLGVTPLGPLELPTVKTHRFRFEKAGFDRWVRNLQLSRDEVYELKPVMEPLGSASSGG